MLEEYWALMGPYQGVDVNSLEPLRILFGFFPTYRQAWAPPCAARMLHHIHWEKAIKTRRPCPGLLH